MKYTKMYRSVMESTKLDLTPKVVLLELINLDTMYDSITPTYEDISKWLCIALRTTKRAISKLEELGYISIKHTPRNNIYILNKEKLNIDFGIYSNMENEEKVQCWLDYSNDSAYIIKEDNSIMKEIINRRKR